MIDILGSYILIRCKNSLRSYWLIIIHIEQFTLQNAIRTYTAVHYIKAHVDAYSLYISCLTCYRVILYLMHIEFVYLNIFKVHRSVSCDICEVPLKLCGRYYLFQLTKFSLALLTKVYHPKKEHQLREKLTTHYNFIELGICLWLNEIQFKFIVKNVKKRFGGIVWFQRDWEQMGQKYLAVPLGLQRDLTDLNQCNLLQNPTNFDNTTTMK